MDDEEIEATICHIGLEGVPRTIPIPFTTMATLFHDEDLDEVTCSVYYYHALARKYNANIPICK